MLIILYYIINIDIRLLTYKIKMFSYYLYCSYKLFVVRLEELRSFSWQNSDALFLEQVTWVQMVQEIQSGPEPNDCRQIKKYKRQCTIIITPIWRFLGQRSASHRPPTSAHFRIDIQKGNKLYGMGKDRVIILWVKGLSVSLESTIEANKCNYQEKEQMCQWKPDYLSVKTAIANQRNICIQNPLQNWFKNVSFRQIRNLH